MKRGWWWASLPAWTILWPNHEGSTFLLHIGALVLWGVFGFAARAGRFAQASARCASALEM